MKRRRCHEKGEKRAASTRVAEAHWRCDGPRHMHTAQTQRGFVVNWLRALTVWLVIIGVEMVQGVLRTLLLQPVVGDFRARQIALIPSAMIILAIAYLFSHWLRATSTPLLLRIGCLWLGLTLLFEVGLGRLVLKLSWDRIVSDYDLSRGGLLTFGLAVLVLSPLIAARLRGRFSG